MGDMYYKTPSPVVVIYPRPDGSPWRLELRHLREVLAAAEERINRSSNE